MLRFGVLGAGRIGKVHARTIAASGKAKVAYLADAMPKPAEDLAAEVGAKVASVEDIIKAKDVDAILIATPTPFHAEQIEAASHAGKAILCEKPVSLSVARIEELLGAVKTLVWNGPFGAFELTPFDAGTNAVAKVAAGLTDSGKLLTVAGGGDTVSALNQAGVGEHFTYISTAGGAFLEWLEGKPLPGVEALNV